MKRKLSAKNQSEINRYVSKNRLVEWNLAISVWTQSRNSETIILGIKVGIQEPINLAHVTITRNRTRKNGTSLCYFPFVEFKCFVTFLRGNWCIVDQVARWNPFPPSKTRRNVPLRYKLEHFGMLSNQFISKKLQSVPDFIIKIW